MMDEYDDEMIPIMYSPIIVPVGNHQCNFNKAVQCLDKSKCSHCGWNPTVFEERRVKTRERLKAEGWFNNE